MTRVALVEDDVEQAEVLGELLQAAGHEVLRFHSGDEALRALERDAAAVDVVLTDVGMQGLDGIGLCRALKESRPELPLIVITGESRQETAVEALRAGAYDFLTKPIQAGLLLPCVRRALERQSLARELRARGRSSEGPLFGESEVMRRVMDVVGRVAPSGASVLIHGETGSGKELVARELHRLSPRAAAPFIAINCAALPASLVESELFGYAKGAFTDARAARTGLFVEASGGTLFLDEVAELSLDNQAKLLRALQERKVRPLGSNAEVPFDARVLCATHRELEQEVAAGRFRQDLFFRLNVIRVDLPPLRQRGMDIVHLAARCLARICERDGRAPLALPPEVANRLLAYAWPGNVRELENCIERLAALARGGSLCAEDLPEKLRAPGSPGAVALPSTPEELVTLEELTRRYIQRVLELCKHNRTKAAQILGIDRRTLYRRLPSCEPVGSPSPRSVRA